MYSNNNNNNSIDSNSRDELMRSKNRVIESKGFLENTNNLAVIFGGARMRPIKKNFCTTKQVFATTLTIALSIVLISDVSRILRSSLNADDASLLDPFQTSSGPKLSAWASWIGEVPTAAELYGDAASEMPTTESFDDDDEDEELDASASNEYPDNENEADESYEDPDEPEQESEQESRINEDWLEPPKDYDLARHSTIGRRRNLATTTTTTKQRNKRDIEDAISLASLRHQAAQRRSKEADEYNVDDGDEDAWINDGVDDIQIDPETKKAASELSFDEKSIDAEYDPHQMKADENKIVNKTRVTTISEVIPMNVPTDTFGDGPMEDKDFTGDKDSTRINSQYLPPPQTTRTMTTIPATTIPTILTAGHLLPASHLSLDQAQQLVAQQAEPHFWSSASDIRTSKISLPPVGYKIDFNELHSGETQIDGATRGGQNSIYLKENDP